MGNTNNIFIICLIVKRIQGLWFPVLIVSIIWLIVPSGKGVISRDGLVGMFYNVHRHDVDYESNIGVTMTEILRSVLVEAINDEYKARATYRLVISKFGEIRPFTSIVEAEGRHIQALLPLFDKYDIPIPEDDWESRIEAPASIKEACHEGVQAEIDNAEMYTRLLDSTKQYQDVQVVLMQLQRASRENHLPAFQRCVERGGGVGEGQCMGRQH